MGPRMSCGGGAVAGGGIRALAPPQLAATGAGMRALYVMALHLHVRACCFSPGSGTQHHSFLLGVCWWLVAAALGRYSCPSDFGRSLRNDLPTKDATPFHRDEARSCSRDRTGVNRAPLTTAAANSDAQPARTATREGGIPGASQHDVGGHPFLQVINAIAGGERMCRHIGGGYHLADPLQPQ